METVRQEDENAPDRVSLKLLLTESNIDRIESMSCQEILSELEYRTRQAYCRPP